MDATKKFETIIIGKKEIKGLPATAVGLAAQTAVSKVFDIGVWRICLLVCPLVHLAFLFYNLFMVLDVIL